MRSLTGVDATFLHLETPQTPMHVASLSLFELPPNYRRNFHAVVKRTLGQRLHEAAVLSRKLAPMPLQFANPVWVEADDVDLDHHVRRVTLPPPGTPQQFEDCAAGLHAELLDRDRPLWQLVVIDGLDSGLIGYYFKAHHAALDGQAGVHLTRTLFDIGPRQRAGSHAEGRASHGEHPGLLDLGAAALRHDAGQYIKLLRHLPDVARTLAGLFAPGEAKTAAPGQLGQNFAFGPRTPLNVPITEERSFAALSLPLDALKAIAQAHEAKLNDVVLALCSGTLRRYLTHHGGIPKKPLTAAMPISVRSAGNTDFTTQATMPLVNLQTQLADPVRRLLAIRDAAGAVKAMVKRVKGVVPMDFPSIGVPWVMRGLAELYGRSHVTGIAPPLANVVISNIPGPQMPLYTAGARMRSYWPMSIVEHGLGLNITVMSYAGEMGFGFTAARSAVPDARALTHALSSAFDELTARSQPRRQPVRSRAERPAPAPGKSPPTRPGRRAAST